MKRLISVLLILTFALSLILTSCSDAQEYTPNETETSTKESPTTNDKTEKSTSPSTNNSNNNNNSNSNNNNNDDVNDTTVYTHLHSYIEDDVFSEITDLFESNRSYGTAYKEEDAPYVMTDVFGLSSSTLKSISIPVMSTGNTDADGNLKLTLYVFNNDVESLKQSEALRKYELAISASQYGLGANRSDIYKVITVDLSEYGIELAANETIAVFAATDTLVPAYLTNDPDHSDPIYNTLKTKAQQMLGSSKRCGRAVFDPQPDSLLFNFTFERSYIGKKAYDAVLNKKDDLQMMIDALKKEYGGLKLSVFGDSISTYTGISNNTDYNSTIGENAVWYGSGAINEALFFDHTYTYWGNMLRELQMELCVNNAWSGDSLGAKRWVNRAKQLHNKDNETPDVILVYFGINDTWAEGRAVGELLTLIENRGSKSVDDVVGEWFQRTIAKNGDCTYWDELYATLIHTIMTEYPAAKIVCMDLVLNGAEAFYYNCDKLVPLYNQALKAITDYLGITLVEQSKVVTGDNCHAYMHDYGQQKHSDGQMKYWGYLHPNARGHRIMFEEIVKTLYSELK